MASKFARRRRVQKFLDLMLGMNKFCLRQSRCKMYVRHIWGPGGSGGIGKLDLTSVADRWEVTPKWEVRPKCFTRKENKERRGILRAEKKGGEILLYCYLNDSFSPGGVSILMMGHDPS